MPTFCSVVRGKRPNGAFSDPSNPCSPDLTPIEHNRGLSRTHGVRPLIFAKLKHWMRTAAPRSRDTLWRSVGTILNRFTPDECANDLKNAGYASV